MTDIIRQYVVSHKNVSDFRLKDRTILFVNENIAKTKTVDTLSTWEGDNIDDKNQYYCELTALYWIYKNIKDDEIVSFEHYRRIFLSPHPGLFSYHFLQKEEIHKIFEKKQIILPLKHHFNQTLKEQYDESHGPMDLAVMERVIAALYPDYKETYIETINGHDASCFNMFVMKKEALDAYCEFAFRILDEVFRLQKHSIMERDTYQQRSVGFLAERLFNVWLNKNIPEQNRFYCSVAYLEKNQGPLERSLKNKIHKLLGHDYDERQSRL